MPQVSGRTCVVGIIGEPVEHSLSPVMQNAAFAAAGLDYIYVPFSVAPHNLEMAVLGLKSLGVCGYNVTIPHKSAIIPFLDKLDESAAAAGAVNVVHLCGNTLTGYNTDGDGLMDSLTAELDFTPASGQIAVIGAGGAARGAVAAFCRAGAERIVICNRSPGNARTLMQDMRVRYPKTVIEAVPMNLMDKGVFENISLLLNTTSLGMNGERVEGLCLDFLPVRCRVYDMVYSLSGTPLVRDARGAGLRAVNGIGMLVAQGERAFRIWTGVKPPDGVMRKTLDSI